jgi:hypothetical protein
MEQNIQEPSIHPVPRYWYPEFEKQQHTHSSDSQRDRRQHALLIIAIIFLTFLLGLVVGHFIWVDPVKENDASKVTTVNIETEPPTVLVGGEGTASPASVMGENEGPISSSSPSPTNPDPSPTSPPMDFDLTPPPITSLPNGQLTVGVYYYPWYKDDFHRGGGYVREQLSPPQYPWLGEYDDSDPATISKHLQWSRQANVGLWVSSWWGKDSREDVTLKTTILTHRELESHQFAIFYETTGRIKQSEGFTTQRVQPDIEYLCQEYFDHPNYYRLDGKPVLFVYLTRKLHATGALPNVLELMRVAAATAGCGDIYIVGDHVFQGPPETEDVYPPFTMLDAVTNYDVYGSMGGKGGYIGQDGINKYYNQQSRWREIATKDYNCRFIPAASPGYNDLGVRPEKAHPPLSRRLSATDKQGSLFEAALRQARTLVDPKAGNLLMVNSFNEWHEGKQQTSLTPV